MNIEIHLNKKNLNIKKMGPILNKESILNESIKKEVVRAV